MSRITGRAGWRSCTSLKKVLGLIVTTVLSVGIRYGLNLDEILGGYGAGFAFALATLLASVLTYTLNSLYTFRTRQEMVSSARL